MFLDYLFKYYTNKYAYQFMAGDQIKTNFFIFESPKNASQSLNQNYITT